MIDVLYNLMIILATVFNIIFLSRLVMRMDKMVSALQQQNNYSLVQVRLMKKMLLNQGVTHEEIEETIEKGNSKQTPGIS